jgi:8-oxo-dGTP pyrophosphatase MutT (NUDIX family)
MGQLSPLADRLRRPVLVRLATAREAGIGRSGDIDLTDVAARLDAHDPYRASDSIDGGEAAATALTIRRTDALDVLFIQRVRRRGDRWSGQMALPGGRREPGDDDLLDTARRETAEEVGLELPSPLGRLDDVGDRFGGVVVAPYVFAVEPDVQPRPSPGEVDEVVWVPLGHLAAPAARTLHFQWGVLPFPAIGYGEHRIWGLTRRIVLDFLALVGA